MAGTRHVNEKQTLAAEQTLGDAALQLHLVVDGRLDHHHAARIDDQPLPGSQIEIEEVSAAVQPHSALALQPLQKEALTATSDTHAELLRECALDLDLSMVAEVRVLLADDLAVQLVLTDRARKWPGDP